MENPEYAIIVAGGKGTRINSKTPKQFLELCGKPILLHTIHAFFAYNENINIVLVLPEDDVHHWHSIVEKFAFTKAVTIQHGGATRFQSVKKGLTSVGDSGLVAVHDGVRPLVTQEIIAESFRLAGKQKSAVASVPLKESIRVMESTGSKAMDRSQFRLIQTPQTFDIQLIKQAYQQTEDPTLTDDASVMERAGHTITLFEGSYENIKVTTAEDLIVAEALLRNRNPLH